LSGPAAQVGQPVAVGHTVRIHLHHPFHLTDGGVQIALALIDDSQQRPSGHRFRAQPQSRETHFPGFVQPAGVQQLEGAGQQAAYLLRRRCSLCFAGCRLFSVRMQPVAAGPAEPAVIRVFCAALGAIHLSVFLRCARTACSPA
jgi:hypothetical protein